MSTFSDHKHFPDYGCARAETSGMAELTRRPRASGPSRSPGVWKWIWMALHESRSREAVRIVARYRRLIDDADQPGGGDVQEAKSQEVKSQEVKPMSVQRPRRPATIPRMLLASIIGFFVVAHGIGLQKMHAFDGADRPAAGPTLTKGD